MEWQQCNNTTPFSPSPNPQCGCYCYSCCSTNLTTNVYSCRDNSGENPCESWEDCQSYDDSRCGIGYSSAYQAIYCAIPDPSTWPALLQIALPHDRAEPWRPSAAILYTGEDEAFAGELAAGLVTTPDPTAAELAAAGATLEAGQARNAVYASAISELGYVLGTWQRVTTDSLWMSFYVEPGFVPSSDADTPYNASLFAMVQNASSPQADASVGALNSALGETGEVLPGFSAPTVAPATGEPVWQASAADINGLLYCGYMASGCYEGYQQINEYTAAYDFADSALSPLRYNATVWYNATGQWSVWQQPPSLARMNQAMNLGSNAFIKQALGPGHRARLLGFMDVPKPSSALRLDFSGLLGPLFFVWLAQLLLPSMLTSLVYEKENRLRTMMKMHGLSDAAYWIVQYLWFFSLNFVYSLVLIALGYATSLAIFRLTAFSYLLVRALSGQRVGGK